jgi:geranylgeranyl reductase family protein
MPDVVVVGGGPAGAAAAKRCAERGLDTLLLEKKRLPREKVCSGLLLGRLAQRLVAEVFGPLPDEVVLTRMKGLCLWMPGVGERRIASETPITWRRDLDHWMVRSAQAAGAEVWEDALVRSIDWGGVAAPSGPARPDDPAVLTIRRNGRQERVEARWIIGADGAYSTVRRCLFPDAGFGTSPAYREWYRGDPGLDGDWVYVTFPRGEYRPNVWICPKDDGFTLEGAGVKPLKDDIRSLLSDAGWRAAEPTWRDGCVSRALLFEHLATGRFTPARDNTLLVGDAAGLQFPISGEGIGTALESGLLAAGAVARAASGGGDAASAYVESLRPLLATLRECYEEVARIRGLSGEALLDGLQDGFAHSLEID